MGFGSRLTNLDTAVEFNRKGATTLSFIRVYEQNLLCFTYWVKEDRR